MSSRYPELLDTVLTEGILRGTESQPIIRVDGTTSEWMLDTLNFSLSARGSKLAALALIDRLRTFKGRQLATFGTTGIPLMQAVLSESKGHYTGLLVRKEVKPYGARLRVHGPKGRGPVIILDDSLASGFSVRECRKHLEENGHDVEGAVVLVRFGYEGVASLLADDGLRAEAIFDTDRDIRPLMGGEELLPLNPGKVFPAWAWARTRAPERAHPASLARDAIESFLRTGTVPRPPRALNRSYDGAGGVFVSLRRRSDIHDRPAREGFWHFPEERHAGVPEELLKACVVTASSLADAVEHPLEVLADCAIAVSFFSRLEPCTVSDLDNERYGIVVRSKERPGIMGGALPRMPGIRDGWHQFRHAAWKNGKLFSCEPYELLRHDVVKCVEPGEAWQPTGVPKSGADWDAHVAPLVALAREWVLFHLQQGPQPQAQQLSLKGLSQVFVSPYIDGSVIGCIGEGVSAATDSDVLLGQLAEAAVKDQRFTARLPQSPDAVTVCFSALKLELELELGSHEATAVMPSTRFGKQALEVHSEGKTGLLLPYVVVTHDLSPLEYAEGVVEKAGAFGEVDWTRYDCSSWVATATGVVRLVDGLPARTPGDGKPAQLGKLWAEFLQAHSTHSGEPINRYLPFFDEQLTGVAAPRLAHSAWVKARLGMKAEARADLAHLKETNGWLGVPSDDEPPTASTLAFAALALSSLGQKRELARVTATLKQLVGTRVKTAPDEEEDQAQDYVPGQVLYALAQTVGKGVDVEAALDHYRRRFRTLPTWGSVAWLTMAFSSWSRVLREQALLDFAWEITDWALQSQAPLGGFWNEHQVDAPGATTAVYLEGFCALLPHLRSNKRRKLQQAITRGFDFLARLTYLPQDAAILPNPAFAVGGVRLSLTSSEVRLDFVQHALSAALLLP